MTNAGFRTKNEAAFVADRNYWREKYFREDLIPLYEDSPNTIDSSDTTRYLRLYPLVELTDSDRYAYVNAQISTLFDDTDGDAESDSDFTTQYRLLMLDYVKSNLTSSVASAFETLHDEWTYSNTIDGKTLEVFMEELCDDTDQDDWDNVWKGKINYYILIERFNNAVTAG